MKDLEMYTHRKFAENKRMKRLSVLTLIISSLLYLILCSFNSVPSEEERLSILLDNKNFFGLKSEFEKSKSQLSDSKRLYFEACLNNAFNDTEASLKAIDILFEKYPTEMEDSIAFDLLGIKADNHQKLYQYRAAYESIEKALCEYKEAVDSTSIADYTNTAKMYNALKEVAPQKMTIRHDVTVLMQQNKISHYILNVRTPKANEDFVFDTGANFSVITKSTAEKLGVRLLETSFDVGTSNKNDIQSAVAVIDSLWIGDILFENVVACVLDDEDLSFPQIDYSIKGIIGFPVMNQMKELRISRAGSLTVPFIPQKNDVNNLFLDGLMPIVSVVSGTDSLLMNMDTGANRSELSKKYFNEHQTEVEKQAVKKKTKRGGAGGIVEVEEALHLPVFDLSINGKSVHLEDIGVQTDQYKFVENSDGNIGQDVILQFSEMVLNLKYMYIDFVK